MKETELKSKDNIEEVKQTKIESQKILVAKRRVMKGHKMFEVNLSNATILKAEFDKKPEVSYKDAVQGNISVKKELTTKPDCLYISALNEKNVIKILKRDYGIIWE